MNISSTNFRLSFNEVNILMENISGVDKTTLVISLQNLSENASDELLKCDTINLSQKISGLTESQFARLQSDAKAGRLVYPPGYML